MNTRSELVQTLAVAGMAVRKMAVCIQSRKPVAARFVDEDRVHLATQFGQ